MEELPLSTAALTRELLSILPLVNRFIISALRTEGSDETTFVQFRVLTLLLEAPMTLSALAKKRRVSLQAASEQIQSLVDRGWVVRVPDPNDRRQALLHITDEGRQQLEDAYEDVATLLIPIMGKLSTTETQSAHEGLLALRRIFSEHDSNPE